MKRLLLTVGLAATALGSSTADGAAPKSFRDCADCPEMVTLPAGRFLMGSPKDELGRDIIEGPRHAVAIRRFAVGKYDVTRGEWRSFVAATQRPTSSGCEWVGPTREHEATSNWRKLDFSQTDRHPVVCVTWNDAQDYVRWLSAKTHHHYRLLSESEWEYAARGSTSLPYPWGRRASHDFANYGKEECCGGLVKGRDRWVFTSPVGAFPPNRFGLYDMGGNVLQYVADCFMPSYQDAPTDGSPMVRTVALKATGNLADLNGSSSCDYRLVRGGDWGDQRLWIRAAARNFAPPPGPGEKLETYRSGGVGFRVARDLP